MNIVFCSVLSIAVVGVFLIIGAFEFMVCSMLVAAIWGKL